MHTLYGYEGSGSAAIEAALQQAGVAFRVVPAASWDGKSAVDELARVNPLKQIPTLVLPDGTVLSESAAILMHLGLAHPASGLLPTDLVARSLALRGLVFIAANCYSAISVGDFPERWTTASDDASRAAVKAAARERLHAHWAVFADLHPQRPFLGGAAPGALDLLASVVSRWSGTRAHLAQARPDFSALLQRVDGHPAYAPIFVRHWPPKKA
ncbi:MAG: glutathione S-transferase family protein [Burkholderiales bacterium]|nr:glutathione S-transferase family protein [Burkholderiales bacterium]